MCVTIYNDYMPESRSCQYEETRAGYFLSTAFRSAGKIQALRFTGCGEAASEPRRREPGDAGLRDYQ